MLAMLTSFALTFTSCSKEDDNADSAAAILEAYGPNPALRGGKLTFIGQNLDKVTKVILPDNIEITGIEVESKDKISIIIPDEAVPGKIKLLTPNGELNPKTLLTFTEPIILSSFAPSPVKPGTTLTIEGDYLNLIQQVIFADNVAVKCEKFTTWERKKIELTVPFETRTGLIILADTAAIRLELESKIELQVILPSVTQTLNLTDKKPKDIINVTVQNIDLVTNVQMPNGSSIAFTKNGNTLTFILPDDITDGPVVMLPASEIPVAIANIGVAIPANLVATPPTDIKAGDEITITGANMELVTTVTFPGVSDAVVPTSKSATEIKVKMPTAATSGDLVLNTASGNTASVTISTLKPEVLSYQPGSVPAGSDVTLSGKNLDLTETVTFGGGKVGKIVSSSATELKVTVPVDAETGEITLTMTNGETTKWASLTITKPLFAYIPVLPGSDVEIKASNILQIAVENGDKLTNVQVNNTTVQYILSGSTLNVLIPNNAGGKTALKLISSNGEVSYDIQVIGNSTIETTIYTGPIELSGWGNNFSIDKTAFENVAAGSIMKIYYAPTGGGDAQIKLNDDDWKVIELTGDPNFSSQWGTLSLPGDATSYEITLTADILTRILTYVASWNNLAGTIIAGQNVIIAKITLITKGGGAAETTIYDDPIDLVGWGNNFSILKKAFENVKAGSTMTVYYTPTGSDTQIKLNDDDWKVIELIGDPNFSSQWGTLTLPGDATSYEITLTADVLTRILTYVASWNNPAGLIIAGQNVTISKITIK
ncbi:MAG: hypothetical protein EZS26_003172 [Candidatus Ordinivivax streblomastigis]|uniref:IPT/TIG domain-containing protein n=1 Tax=Candidatus Ordinivivax streblomastigis TaxID=2540710 RepID=A0A5M8NXV6_9BACT|nr:MAG: hypothetical protein EZS26_003172 [Candidatus Ordinivivax streblomastigis]